MHIPEVMLLGGPNSGKTHYAGQLYGRLQRNPGALKIRSENGTPPDLSALDEVLKCLACGHAASHTPIETWSEVLLPLVNGCGKELDLRWPDYGGEQLKRVFDEREVPESWRGRLLRADGWVLLIRLHAETTYDDALADLVKRSLNQERSKAEQRQAGSWDANAYWVELLQILLHVAEKGTVSKIVRPRLAVLLSCYDEFDSEGLTPSHVLTRKLPLVSSFIENNWSTGSATIWGLSALGCPLVSSSSDEKFIDQGPETQGWIVPPSGGAKDSDLTKPLAWLLEYE